VGTFLPIIFLYFFLLFSYKQAAASFVSALCEHVVPGSEMYGKVQTETIHPLKNSLHKYQARLKKVTYLRGKF
jgi:hypothetical protein